MARTMVSRAITPPDRRPARLAREGKDARLNFRLPKEGSALIQKAAELEHRTLTDFCVNTLLDAARETVKRHEQIELSARDRAAFFDALMCPPEPNDRLRRAARASKARVRP